MQRIHLAAALVERDGRILLAASRYPSHADPLWNLPGGRQCEGELLEATALRELLEETGLHGSAPQFAYLAESYDGDRHFINAVFRVSAAGDAAAPAVGDHVAAVEWVSIGALAERLQIAVVREPLLAYLRGGRRYTAFSQAGVSVRWFDES